MSDPLDPAIAERNRLSVDLVKRLRAQARAFRAAAVSIERAGEGDCDYALWSALDRGKRLLERLAEAR